MTETENEGVRSEFLPLSILRALWKRKGLIALTWLGLSGIGGLIVFLLPSIYEASTIILIERQRIPERYVASTVNEDLSNRLNRISQQILSFEPLLRLIEEFNLYEDERDSLAQEEVVQEMRDDIVVALVPGWTQTDAPAFSITYEGEDPSIVAQVANRLATLFIDENLRTRANQAIGTTEFLTNQLEEARQELERQEAAVSDYRLRNNGELPEQEEMLLTQLRSLEAELDSAEQAASRAHQTRMMLESSLESARSTLQTYAEMADDDESRRRAQADSGRRSAGGLAAPGMTDLERAEFQLEQAKARYSSAHPDIRRFEAAVEQLRSQELARAGQTEGADSESGEGSGKTDGEAVAALMPPSTLRASIVREQERVAKIEAQIEVVLEQIEAAGQRRNEVVARIGAVQSRLTRIPLHQQQMAQVVRDYDISMENYRSLLDKRIEADLASEMETRQKAEKFSVLEAARLPEVPVRPDRPLAMAVVVAIAIGIACVAGFLVELRHNVLLGEWELPAEAVVLGQVPFILTESPSEASASSGRSTRGFVLRFQRRAIIASSVLLASVATIVATSVYFGWIAF